MCKSPWCERPSLGEQAAPLNLFTAPDRDYCCPECRMEDERPTGGLMEDADHGYSCRAS